MKLNLQLTLILCSINWNVYFCESVQPCSVETSEDISLGKNFTNGSIVWNGIVFEEQHRFLDENGILRGCICLLKNCLRYCCPRDHFVDLETYDCLPEKSPNAELLMPNVYEKYNDKPIEIDKKTHFYLLHSMVKCEEIYELDDKEFYLLPDGKILFNDNINSHEDYCLHVNYSKNVVNTIACITDKIKNVEFVLVFLDTTGLIISLPFLLATLIIYCFIPELHGNIQGKTLMGYVSALFTENLFMAYYRWSIHTDNIANPTGCTILGFLGYLIPLMKYFWLNTMSFDMCLAFRRMERVRDRSTEKRRFLLYSCYAFGVPLLLTGICILMDYTPNLSKSIIIPGIGGNTCWLNGYKAQLYYFYLPISIIINVNIIFFIITTRKILKITRETSVLRRDESGRNSHENDKQRFILYLKLFLIMGVTLAVKWIGFVTGTKRSEFNLILDLLNAFIGVFIFMVFIYKKKVKKLVVKRYRGYTQNHRKISSQLPDVNTNSSSSENRTETSTLPRD